MTSPTRPDPDERDPALDAAWRAYSVETPPPALDAAILAAAHREARSRPRPAGDDDDTLAEAREPSRWWWGLAAAATIGAIAFGVVQLAPPPAPGDATVATDMPATGSRPAREAQPTGEPRVPSSPPNEISTPDPLPPSAEPKREEARGPAAARAPESRREAAPAAEHATQPAAKARSADDVPADRASRGTPEPFPLTALPPSVEPQRERALTREAIVVAPQGSAAPPAGAVGAAAPAVDAEASRAGATRSERASAPRPLAQKHADAVSAEAFVTRLRDFVNAGRLDEAVRELQAFRAAYADADARLPEPLKAWAATVPR